MVSLSAVNNSRCVWVPLARLMDRIDVERADRLMQSSSIVLGEGSGSYPCHP